MRLFLSAAILAATALAAPAAQAQGGELMWCTATADNGTEKTYYFSAFFPAGAWEADRKAFAFKREVEEREISAATVTAAMKAAPGTVLSWEG